MHEKNDEQYRIRKVKIFFYLEDDSVQVNEPPIENSGIPQGNFLSKLPYSKMVLWRQGLEIQIIVVKIWNLPLEEL